MGAVKKNQINIKLYPPTYLGLRLKKSKFIVFDLD